MQNARLPANIHESDSETPWLTTQMINFLKLENEKDPNKKVKWEWVKGHSSDKLNNKVDEIARNEANNISYNEEI